MRGTLRSVGVAAVAVLAVSLSAATLDSTTTTGRREPSSAAGSGGATGGPLPLPESGTVPGKAIAAPIPPELFVVAGALAVLVVVVYLVVRRRATVGALVGLLGLLGLTALVSPAIEPLSALLVVLGALAVVAYAAVYRRAVLRGVLVSLAALVALVVFAQFLTSAVPRSPTSVTDPVPGTAFGGSGGGGVASQVTPPTLLVASVLGLALVGAALALRGSSDDGGSDPGVDDPEGDRTAAVGRAAGRAADRIEGRPEVDNEVYRAWREMTGLLDVPTPETSTPGEFADAAVDAGLGNDDVADLTRLFEEVRYGGTPPTDEYERRAIAVFRRIETRYREADA